MSAVRIVTTLVLCCVLLAGTVASGDCFCVGCTHEPQLACGTCDQTQPVKKSCCSEEQERPESSSHECSHLNPTLKAPGSSAAPIALVASAPPGDPSEPSLALFETFETNSRSPEHVKRKIFLLNSSLLF